jgi:coiled-coil domain-containing protein 77
VRAREEELKALASLHTSTKAAAEEHIAELEARCTKLKEANRSLEMRRQLDVDGWTADVTLLRKQLAAVDRKLLQMRLIDRWGRAGRGRESGLGGVVVTGCRLHPAGCLR